MTIVDDFSLLKKYGFRLLPYFFVKTEDDAVAAAKKIGYPVVLKIVSPEIEHKTDVGGVKIDIKNETVLRHTYRDMMQNVKGKKIDGVLVQKMARKGLELIIGGKKDPQFGHMVIIGLGGIYVEIFRDISARICPLTALDVEEMVAELKVHPLLEGARGKKPINKKALEDLVLRACGFMEKEGIVEMDLNPVVFDDEGCDIVDARFSR
ncbi:acetate--CoA ligase family protein [Candidatus Micrarchaeota archaeon]|nr:acetate--CoA ligase family protein [Candidatus Micrarchaeota archaeon]